MLNRPRVRFVVFLRGGDPIGTEVRSSQALSPWARCNYTRWDRRSSHSPLSFVAYMCPCEGFRERVLSLAITEIDFVRESSLTGPDTFSKARRACAGVYSTPRLLFLSTTTSCFLSPPFSAYTYFQKQKNLVSCNRE